MTQVGTFLVLPFLWKYLRPSDYGIIGVSEIITSFLGILWGLSLEASVSRFYYEWSPEERRARLGSVWIAAWSSAIVLGFLSIFAVYFTSEIFFPDVQFFPLLFLGMTQGIMLRMRQITFHTIRIVQMPWVYFWYSFAVFAISTSMTVTFVVWLEWGVLGYFVAWNLSEAVLLLPCSALMMKFATPRLKVSEIREAVAYALPLIPNNFISSISSVSDRFILQRFASLEALGIFTLCMKFTNIIILTSDAVKMSFAPFMFKAVSEEGRAAVKKISEIRMYYLIPIFVAALGLALFIQQFVQIVNQPDYFPIANYIPLLVGPAVILTLFPYFASGMLLAKRTKMMIVPSLIQLVLVVICGSLLIPDYQIYGIVYARYFTMIAFVGTGVFLSQRYFPIPIDTRKLVLLFTILSIGIVVSMVKGLPNGSTGLMLNCGIFTILSALVIITVSGASTSKSHLINILKKIR